MKIFITLADKDIKIKALEDNTNIGSTQIVNFDENSDWNSLIRSFIRDFEKSNEKPLS
jgi:hypothetical protein